MWRAMATSDLSGRCALVTKPRRIVGPSFIGTTSRDVPSFDATLTFVENTVDNRCPADATCVWEGEAKVLLAFARSGYAPVSYEIAGFVGPEGNQQAGQGLTHEAFGLGFTLLRLDPTRSSTSS